VNRARPVRGARRATTIGRTSGLALVLTLLAACASLAPDTAAAAAAAIEFHRALADDDGAAACATLAPATVESLEDDSGTPCVEAVLDEDLPPAERVISSQAFGQGAQVVLDNDVLFLAAFGDRWLITAAGCQARDNRPYQCSIEKG
jgi:hypothetical protein